VLVSSAWHWMDPGLTLAEVERVRRPGGFMGVVWSGPDRSIEWVGSMLGQRDPSPGEPVRIRRRLELPSGSPFDGLERCRLDWTRPLGQRELIGLAGTFSSVITMPDEQREAEARRIEELLETVPASGVGPRWSCP
jgi:SAM-dependent methyltransferase